MRNCCPLFMLVLSAPLFPQPSGLTVSKATPTRVVISYRAPSPGACTLKLSTSVSLTPLVPDVDPAIFASSDQDLSRTTTATNGNYRVAVLGQRTAGALTGHLYSRALAQNTSYYGSVACDGVATTFTASTAPLSFGWLAPENPPFISGSGSFGNYAWPTVDWTDKTTWYTDPQTGVEFKPAHYPGEFSNRYPASGTYLFGAAPDFVSCGVGWTNCNNIRSGSAASTATATATTNAAFVGIDPTVTTPGLAPLTGIDGKTISIDDFSIVVFGSGSSGTAANRVVNLCWSADQSTCRTTTLQVTLPSGADACTGEFWGALSSGTSCPDDVSVPGPMFAGWSDSTHPAMTRLELGRTGTVSTNGTAITMTDAVTTDNAFYWGWLAGAKIWIQGTDPLCANNWCTIASVQGPSNLTISEILGVLSGRTYKYAPVLRVAKNNATGNINISLAHRVGVSNVGGLPPGGSFELCSQVSTTTSVSRTGTPITAKSGRICYMDEGPSQAGTIRWVGDDGDVRMLYTFKPVSSLTNSVDAADLPNQFTLLASGPSFDSTDGRQWYAVYQNSTTTKRAIYRFRYTGDFRQWAGVGSYPVGNADQPSSPSYSVEATILTKMSTVGTDVQSMVDTNYPTYSKTVWGDLGSTAIGTGFSGTHFAVFKQGFGGVGESPVCWTFVWDVSTTPATFVRGYNNYDGVLSPYMRWGACHASLGIGGPATNTLFHAFNLNTLGQGAYTVSVTHVKRSGVYSTNTALPASYDGTYDGDCPVNTYGAVTPNCVQIKTGGEACKTATLSNPDEHTTFPCPRNPGDTGLAGLSNIAVGDVVYDNAAYDGTERLRVLEKTTVSATEVNLTLQRDIIPATSFPAGFGNACNGGTRIHSNGWTMAMGLGGGRTCNVSSILVSTSTGTAYGSPLFDHFDWGVGQRWVGTSNAYTSGSLTVLNTQYPDLTLVTQPTFSNTANPGNISLQSYPSSRQWVAPSSETGWSMNNRHVGPVVFNTLTSVSGSLYTLNVIGTVNMKTTGLNVTASGQLFQDISSSTTGNQIGTTSTDNWKYCYVLNVNECRTGSVVGTLYVNLPAPLTGSNIIVCGDTSDVGRLAYLNACAYSGSSVAAWSYQYFTNQADPQGLLIRRVTLQPGAQRQGGFENIRALPDGKLALWRNDWEDGLFSALSLVRLPASTRDSRNRTTFLQYPVAVPAGAGDRARVKFWYTENGTGNYCTTRLEACYAVTGSLSESTPFLYEYELISTSGVSCASGCTVMVPLLPDRVGYMQVQRTLSGSVVQSYPVTVD